MLVRGRRDFRLSARVVEARPLPGVRAGSGLVRRGSRLLVVQDDAFAIAWVDVGSLEIRLVALRGDGAPLAKMAKPDFEAAATDADGAVWLVGSGSTEQRCVIARVDVDATSVTLHERPEIFDAVSVAAELAGRPNVEGVVIDREAVHLFHRGAATRSSVIVSLSRDALTGARTTVVARRTFELGALDGVPLGFTDATLAAGTTFFLAAAEATDNAIDDGRVAGSVIGRLDALDATWAPLVDERGDVVACKAEGVVVDDDRRGAWVVTDPDDAKSPALLLRIALDGFDGAG